MLCEVSLHFYEIDNFYPKNLIFKIKGLYEITYPEIWDHTI